MLVKDERGVLQEKGGPEKVLTEEEKSQAQEMANLKAEVNALWEEYKGQLDSRTKQQEAENSLKQQVDKLFEKRDSLRKERVSSTTVFHPCILCTLHAASWARQSFLTLNQLLRHKSQHQDVNRSLPHRHRHRKMPAHIYLIR